MTHTFSDLYQRIWVNQENPFDEYEGINYFKPFKGLGQNIIVRDEYHTIWDFVSGAYQVRASNEEFGESGGLVVTGQPGIGKTLFLAYALVKALKERIPVSYCVNLNEIFIFNKDGFQKGSSASDISSPECTLCLVDSGVNLTKPPAIVLTHIDNYIVQAASPKPDHWRQWSKQRLAAKWVMDLWTKDEMEKLVRLRAKSGITFPPDSSRYSPLELFDVVGPSPRDCISTGTRLTFIKKPEGPETIHPYGDLATLLSDTRALERVIKTGVFPRAEQGEDFLTFFFGGPLGENPVYLQPRFRYVVPTGYLEDRLCDYIIKEKQHERYRLLCAFAPLPQAFAPIYESYIVSHMHDLRESLPCYLLSNLDSPSFQLPAGLSLGRLPVESGLGRTEFRDNTIYVTRFAFPSLHAFIISDNMTRITMVQINVSDRHDLEISGVRRVIDHLKEELPDTVCVQWSFLFVAPGRNRKKAAEAREKYKLELREVDPEVRIGWISTSE
ncbi:hypothetical protein Agabi119p4_9908 [Agaricus bisporus var. burnettii]|uniref:Uncharacterized protein n=1 Tax=Agaricus bisporus var. burnettii TaxID=192524 RepID=A0A8H7C4P0_AGABI|nr:hypothetical protein Agabi119p4_9908 [Agaricus bisporus var. burnettii]